ncbi:ABC-F family ATP-binding cassette domain-containing protein [Seleniivibrio woodruffii]|uniref:ABC-F family ATP-binding cassette domain-containing protein n=1 Tax=Seleniivibrio woodruffii TaxID=1078050 RepID=UPI0026E96269|nr:ABC-F family ATP-binding cassette domain-containing protein [Seleniivibrio woodruffii]
MLSVENLSKSYGARTLFKDISFRVNSGERVGLVGRNGHGKTTLMRILTGEQEQDDGIINVPRNYTLGYLQQVIDFKHKTAREEAASGLKEAERDDVWKAEKILSGLGFSDEDMDKSPNEFSGGYQVRLNLAKLLLSEPDMLLLDEPTNYLDITSIRWLEQFLIKWKGELMLITHDRAFMDRVVTHTLGIHRLQVRKIKGDTGKFYEQIAADEEIYEKTRQNEELKRKEVERFVERFKSKASLASRVQSRVKMLEKMSKKDKLDEIEDLEFCFNYSDIRAKELINVRDITFGYDKSNPLIKNFSITIGSGEKICIIGKNGKGKTTLLKMLCGISEPDSGVISNHAQLKPAVYEQTNVQRLGLNNTIEQELIQVDPSIDRQRARDAAGTMMFSGDDALKKISVLSGGEKSRVMLAKAILEPANILFLDEPTNHLDMQSCDSLLEAVDQFKGTVVMVTHNEMFLNAIAERLIVFRNDTVEVFEGGYEEFLEKVGWGEEFSDKTSAQVSANSKKEQRKLRSEIIAEKGKVLKPIQERHDSLEKDIAFIENRIEILNRELIDASSNGEPMEIARLSKELDEAKKSADDMVEKFLETAEQLETLTAQYEEKLNQLG